MSTATIIAQEDEKDAKPHKADERRCIVTGEMRGRDDLIRFVLGPDQTVVPDLSQNLPGRGLWVSAERSAIEVAARKNLFARAAKENAKTDAGLADHVATLLKKRVLDMLGLAKGAGIATLGQPQVEAAVKAGKVDLLFVAPDASSSNLIEKPDAIRALTRTELGSALGYDQVVYVGLKAHSLTNKLRQNLKQLEKVAETRHLHVNTDSGNQ